MARDQDDHWERDRARAEEAARKQREAAEKARREADQQKKGK